MRHSLLHTVGNIVWVARNEREQLAPLLVAYSRLKALELATTPGRKNRVRRTRVLGMDVAFFDAFWLVEMFEEIFLRKQYYFDATTTRPVIVDVGSNIGLSLLYFKWQYPHAVILGFEPDPSTFHVLEANVKQNRLEDVRVLNQAVFDGTEWLDLFGDPDTPGSPQHSVRSGRVGGTARRVRGTRLSEHLTQPIDLLKVDIEGAERVVVDELERSGKLTLISRMAIEYHHHVEADDDKLGDLLATLERNDFGYQIDARMGGSTASRRAEFQNILIHAYRKQRARRVAGQATPTGDGP
jgi:FkbM family methyltransferase